MLKVNYVCQNCFPLIHDTSRVVFVYVYIFKNEESIDIRQEAD